MLRSPPARSATARPHSARPHPLYSHFNGHSIRHFRARSGSRALGAGHLGRGSSELLGVPAFAPGLLSIEFGKALDQGVMEGLEPFGPLGLTVFGAQTGPNGTNLLP